MQEIVSTDRRSTKYRNRIDIVAAILEVTASGGTTKSNLFYKSFVNYERLRSYMTLLIENELIESCRYDEEDNILYRTTEKGRHFLQIYNNMRELIDFI
jgi:predicted transcriptional regulator